MAINKTLQVDYSGLDIVCNSLIPNTLKQSVGTRVQNSNGAAPTSVTTTSTTVTAAIILGGILVDSNAGAVTATLDTAANLVSAVNTAYSGANVGDLYYLEIINGGNTSGAITVAAGTGGTFDANVPAANKVIAINLAKTVIVRLTNVTPGSEAYVVYM